jgi:hypothetical protein
MTSRQQNDIEVLLWFMPEQFNNILITKEDKKDFLNHSDNGIKPIIYTEGYKALTEAKRLRGITIHELWEKGILEGSVPYRVILEGMPKNVMEFIKREMFKGSDSELIESLWNAITSHLATI